MELWSVESPHLKDHKDFITQLPQCFFSCAAWERRIRLERFFLRRHYYEMEDKKPREMDFNVGDVCYNLKVEERIEDTSSKHELIFSRTSWIWQHLIYLCYEDGRLYWGNAVSRKHPDQTFGWWYRPAFWVQKHWTKYAIRSWGRELEKKNMGYCDVSVWKAG